MQPCMIQAIDIIDNTLCLFLQCSFCSLVSLYLILGAVYIVVSLGVRISHAVVFELFDDDIAVKWPDNGPE